MSFVYADLPNHGLGNLLFPWMRSELYARDHDLRVIAPRWSRLRVGPYLRGDADKRRYGGLFKSQSALTRARRTYLLSRLTVLEQSSRREDSPDTVRVFTGMEDWFNSFIARRELVREIFIENLREVSWTDGQIKDRRPYIGVHIRLGDFARQGPASARNTSTSLLWYQESVQRILGQHPGIPVVLCSDGSDGELSSFVSTVNATRSKGNNPIQDMFTLANASLILGSGSTFSAWANFLGTGPMILEPEKNHYAPTSNRTFECLPDQVASNELVEQALRPQSSTE